MEGELKKIAKVWILTITCLSYCYYISSRIPKGLSRLVSLLPVFYLFVILPFNISSPNLSGLTSFFLVWLANFKLILFAFNQGPLSPLPNKLFHFISIACLPIKIKQDPPMNQKSTLVLDPNPPQILPKSILLTIKAVLLVLLFYVYSYKQYLNQDFILVLYCCHIYLQLEISLAIFATPAKSIFGFELEPQFNEPYLSTSLQDFWGHRWNLMVTSILHPTIYTPVRGISTLVIGPKWAPLPGVIATFVTSGLMHEVQFYYITRVPPTWEVLSFFSLHGMCLVVEVMIKRALGDRWKLHRAVSGPLVVVFMATTSARLFWPQLLRNGVDERTIKEFSDCVEFFKNIGFNVNAF